jgi:hypothetical protein
LKYFTFFPWYQTSFINPLKPSGKLYVPAALTISNSAFCIYGFCMIVGVNRDYCNG